MRTGRRTTIGALALLSVACTAADTLVEPSSRAAALLDPPSAAVDTLAYLLARAMQDQSVRRAVRDELRQSPMVEHKVDFGRMMHAPAGAAIRRYLSERLNISEQHTGRLLATSGTLELYMPGSTYRRSWRGGSEIVVAAAVGSDRSILHGYAAGGSGVVVDNRVDARGRPPALFLARAETHWPRLAAVSSSLRATHSGGDAAIEEPGESQIGGGVRIVGRDGRVTVLGFDQLESMSEGETCNPETALDFCDPAGGTGGGGDGTVPPRTYISGIEIGHVCDWNNCGENNEFEWHNYTWNGSTWANRYDYALSVPPDWQSPPGFLRLANYYVPGWLQSDIIESDGDFGNDDHFEATPGVSPRWKSTENNFWKEAGKSTCPNGNVDPITHNCRLPYIREVNTQMRWY